MKPNIYIVSDEKLDTRHRAFSTRQAAFCGRVPRVTGERTKRFEPWKFCDIEAQGSRDCRVCADSPLNGEVALVKKHYIPVAETT